MLYYFKKRANECKHRKICAVYGGGSVTDRTSQKRGLQTCVREISCWMMLHSQVDCEVDSDHRET